MEYKKIIFFKALIEQTYLYTVVVFHLYKYINYRFLNNELFLFYFKMQRGTLILEDDSEFNGSVFGAATNATGEVGKILLIDLFFCYVFLFLFSLSNWYGRLY